MTTILPEQDYVIKTQNIQSVVGLHPRTLKLLESRGEFPARVRLSTRQHGWMASSVYRWLEDRRNI